MSIWGDSAFGRLARAYVDTSVPQRPLGIAPVAEDDGPFETLRGSGPPVEIPGHPAVDVRLQDPPSWIWVGGEVVDLATVCPGRSTQDWTDLPGTQLQVRRPPTLGGVGEAPPSEGLLHVRVRP